MNARVPSLVKVPSRATVVLLAVVAATSVAACGDGRSTQPTNAAPAPVAPSAATDDRRGRGEGPSELASLRFTAPTLDGGSIDTAALIGHEPVAFWAWAPWCSTCNREAPTVRAAVEQHGDTVRFIGVPGRDGTERMRIFVERHDLGLIPHAVDGDGALWTRLGVRGQPTWVLVDRAGNVERLFGLVSAAELDERLLALAAP